MNYFLKHIENDKKLLLTFYLTVFGSVFLSLFFIISVANDNAASPVLFFALCFGFANLWLLTTRYQQFASINLAIIVGLISFSLLALGGHKGTGYFWTFPNITIAIAVLSVKQGLWYSLVSLSGCAFILFMSTDVPWILDYEPDVAARYLMASTALHLMSLILMNIQEKTDTLLQLKMVTDDLTGLFNRGVLKNEKLEITNRRRNYDENHVLLLDVDHFKSINDTLGHSIGDKVLVDLANIMKEETRQSDLAIRWGGEEFLVILKNCCSKDAINKAEQVRKKVEQSTILKEIVKRPVTISIGLSKLVSGQDIHDALVIADENLYAAKEAGRNKVVG